LTDIKPFKLSALENLSKIIGDRYKGTEITELFNKAGFPEIQYETDESIQMSKMLNNFGMQNTKKTKWRFVYEVFQNMQKEHDGIFNILKVIEVLCDPQEYFSKPEDHEHILSNINHILSFYALKIGKNGKIIKIDNEETDFTNYENVSKVQKIFESRNFHPEVRRNGQDLFAEERYFHAVFECSKALEKYIQQKSQSTLSGTKLMNNELSLDKGSLKINSQQTQTEKDEQEGIRDLCRGLMMSIRNFTAHELASEKPIPKEDALDILSLISYLYRKIDNAVCFKLNN